jgi:glycosyltransferase involved in cell wall biosynthesis
LRPFFRRWFARQLRNQCRHAAAAAYVTAHALQQRYPPGPDTWSTHFSDVEVEGFLGQQPRAAAAKSAWQLVTVGSLAHLYKGVDTLLDALAGCRRSGLDLRLSVVGGGQHLEELRRRAAGLGVLQHVLFRGQVASREELAAELDRADLFVLPSRQEGLPRALLEAMARGLPCIGSDVGGIPELLPAADLTPANQPVALSRKIAEVLQSPSRLAAMSQRNLTTAQGYSEGELGQRRTAFYQRVRAVTAGWSGEQTAPMASGTPHTACNRG